MSKISRVSLPALGFSQKHEF